MDIFSTPAAVIEGPVSLPELLEESNRIILNLTRSLEEKQRGLDEITALLKNERNRRLTAQSSLEDANKALEELKRFSHELTHDKRLLGRNRISGEICTGSDIASTCSEGLLGEQSVSLPDESLGIKAAEASLSSSSNGDKDLQNEMESGQDQESFSESTSQHTRKLKLHQMIQQMLERQRRFTKLFDDKTDVMINELMESLNAFNRLRSSLQILGEPGRGINTQAEKYHEDHRQRELTKATHGLSREETRVQKLQVHLARLRMEQTIHERKTEQEMNGFKDSAFYADRKHKDPAGAPMVFSQVNYRLKLARLIWDGAAHFSKKDASNDEHHSDND